jgi:hypothetical protein
MKAVHIRDIQNKKEAETAKQHRRPPVEHKKEYGHAKTTMQMFKTNTTYVNR